MESVKPLFPLGKIVATPGALDAMARANQQSDHFLNRHVKGDWGAELSEEDKAENNYSLEHGFRILSSYKTAAGDKLWLITESDRSVTTLLRPEDY